jgi:enoyl-CoA hydratase/carnithine racemase
MTTVLYDKRDRIAYVTIARPEARNAIDLETHEALCAAWADFRAIVDLGLGGLTRGMLRWNVVTKVVAHDGLMAEAEQVARQLLRNSQRAVRSAKETILDVVGKDLDDQLRTEAWNAYTVADPEETLGLLQRFHDRTDVGRA